MRFSLTAVNYFKMIFAHLLRSPHAMRLVDRDPENTRWHYCDIPQRFMAVASEAAAQKFFLLYR